MNVCDACVNQSSNVVYKSPAYNFDLVLGDNGLGKRVGDLVYIHVSVQFTLFKRSSKPLLCVADDEGGSPDS